MNLEFVTVGKTPPYGGDPAKHEIDKASGLLVVDNLLYKSREITALKAAPARK